MTAHAMNEHRNKSLLAGMDDYISKPIQIAALNSVLGKWLHPVMDSETYP
jgi:CheY-like chemotaxis protein